MPINVTNLVDRVEELSINTQTSTLDLAKLNQVNDLIDSVSTINSVDNRVQLPAAWSNKGRFIYLRDSAEILYSNGAIWTQQRRVNQQIWAWGRNSFGQLGDTTVTSKSSPVQEITSSTNWQQISAGYSHTVGVKTDGTLWSWGRNNFGQLGDNTTTNKSSPVQEITASTNWKQAGASISSSSSNSNTAATKTDGTIWSWGANGSGQLGTGDLTNRSSPVQEITSSTNWLQVSSGVHTVAIKTDGTLWAWGSNYSGQLGDGTGTSRGIPTQEITSSTNWSQFSRGEAHTTAIKTDGTLWAWGANTTGQLGNNSTLNRSSPVQEITGSTNWSQVSAGSSHTAAIKIDGTLWAWGDNSFGRLGDGTTTSRLSPVQEITGSTNWSQVATGVSNTAAVKTNGTLWSWGYNVFGTLGDGTITHRSSPVQEITGSNMWIRVHAANLFTVALKAY